MADVVRCFCLFVLMSSDVLLLTETCPFLCYIGVCPAGEKNVNNNCEKCDKGSYKVGSNTLEFCRLCLSGQTTDGEGAASSQECIGKIWFILTHLELVVILSLTEKNTSYIFTKYTHVRTVVETFL